MDKLVLVTSFGTHTKVKLLQSLLNQHENSLMSSVKAWYGTRTSLNVESDCWVADTITTCKLECMFCETICRR